MNKDSLARLEKERLEFLDWKGSISCEGNPKEKEQTWQIIMDGPDDSPYNGGKFKIEIIFPDDYPKKAPTFNFLTNICHINIDSDTKYICLDSLHEEYKPEKSIVELLAQIFMLMTSPNEESPFTKYKTKYFDDYEGYLALAREMTREYAK